MKCNFTKRELQIISNVLPNKEYLFKDTGIDVEISKISKKANKYRGKLKSK